jgi:hypothetical protein
MNAYEAYKIAKQNEDKLNAEADEVAKPMLTDIYRQIQVAVDKAEYYIDFSYAPYNLLAGTIPVDIQNALSRALYAQSYCVFPTEKSLVVSWEAAVSKPFIHPELPTAPPGDIRQPHEAKSFWFKWFGVGP